jgi:hypothetical protein
VLDVLDGGTATVVLLAWVSVAALASIALVQRRDVT